MHSVVTGKLALAVRYIRQRLRERIVHSHPKEKFLVKLYEMMDVR